MLVAIDIGNSNVVIGVHRDQWLHVWRIPTLRTTDVNFYKLQTVQFWVEAGLDMEAVDQVVVSSVVPELTKPTVNFCSDLFRCPVLQVGAELYPRVDLQIERPHEIGSDLVANAFAALEMFRANALVIDFGTALTFTAVGTDRCLHGVSIAPGVKTALRSLHSDTARLPEVPLEFPENVAGKDTIQAIQSGVLIGYEGLIQHLITRYRTAFEPSLITVATGGVLNALRPLHVLFDHVVPTLTLDGLRLMVKHVQS